MEGVLFLYLEKLASARENSFHIPDTFHHDDEMFTGPHCDARWYGNQGARQSSHGGNSPYGGNQTKHRIPWSRNKREFLHFILHFSWL